MGKVLLCLVYRMNNHVILKELQATEGSPRLEATEEISGDSSTSFVPHSAQNDVKMQLFCILRQFLKMTREKILHFHL